MQPVNHPKVCIGFSRGRAACELISLTMAAFDYLDCPFLIDVRETNDSEKVDNSDRSDNHKKYDQFQRFNNPGRPETSEQDDGDKACHQHCAAHIGGVSDTSQLSMAPTSMETAMAVFHCAFSSGRYDSIMYPSSTSLFSFSAFFLQSSFASLHSLSTPHSLPIYAAPHHYHPLIRSPIVPGPM